MLKRELETTVQFLNEEVKSLNKGIKKLQDQRKLTAEDHLQDMELMNKIANAAKAGVASMEVKLTRRERELEAIRVENLNLRDTIVGLAVAGFVGKMVKP